MSIGGAISTVIANKRPVLSILIYHQIFKKYDYLHPSEPTVSEFDRQMSLVKKFFTPLSLNEALQKFAQGTLPRNAVCITFDDGYLDNYTLALPILKKWNIPATIFIATDFSDGGVMWNDTVLESIRNTHDSLWDLEEIGLGKISLGSELERYRGAMQIINGIKHLPAGERKEKADYIGSKNRGSPPVLMMNPDQLREINKEGIELGAHTLSHPILNQITPETAEREIKQSKIRLEMMIDNEVRFFAYPNGGFGKDFSEIHMEIVKKSGFQAAVSTDHGVSTRETDLYRLARFTPWDKSLLKFYLRLLRNTYNTSD